MRRSRVTGGTARSMAVATIRTVRWIVVDSPGSRVLRTAMAADMGSVLKLDNSLKSSSHRLTSRSRTTRPLSANTTGSCRRSRHLVSENSQTPRRSPSGHLFRPGQIPDQYARVEEDHSAASHSSASHSSPIGLIRSPTSISALIRAGEVLKRGSRARHCQAGR